MNEESITALQLGDSLVPMAVYPFIVLMTTLVVAAICRKHEMTRHIPAAIGWTLTASAFIFAAMAVPHEYLSKIFWLLLMVVCVIDAIALWQLAIHGARRYLASQLVRQQDADAS